MTSLSYFNIKSNTLYAWLFFFFSALVFTWVSLSFSSPIWWDEGWTILVAKNWASNGHYGRYYLGQPIGRGLEATFLLVSPIAFIFKYISLDINYVRAFQSLLTFLSLTLLFSALKNYLNFKSVAISILILFCCSVQPLLNPLFVSSQIISESLMLLFLLLGCVYVNSFINNYQVKNFLMYIFLFTLVIISKPQPLPFLTTGFIVLSIVYILSNQYLRAALFFISPFLIWFLSYSANYIFSYFFIPVEPISIHGLTKVVAFDFSLIQLKNNLSIIFHEGLIATLSIAIVFYYLIRNVQKKIIDKFLIFYFTLVFTWFIWFVFFSIGWQRYFYPIFFLSTPFFAIFLLEHLYNIFVLKEYKKIIVSFLIMPIVCISVINTFKLLRTSNIDEIISTKAVAEYINSISSKDSIIETYDPEVQFFLDRKYTYPSDQVHVHLNNNSFRYANEAIKYTSISNNPSYLVMSSFVQSWGLYDKDIKSNKYNLLNCLHQYCIYSLKK